MIYLEKGKPLFDNPGVVVYDATGYYEDGDSVVCAMVYAPDEPVCRYEAKFIAFGSMVYNITDPEKLLEDIKKIDPETLFGKSTADLNLDKKIQEIETADNSDTAVKDEKAEPEEETNETENSETEENVAEEVVNEPVIPEQTSSSTDPIPDAVIPEQTSSSTTPIAEPENPVETPIPEEIPEVIENVVETEIVNETPTPESTSSLTQ